MSRGAASLFITTLFFILKVTIESSYQLQRVTKSEQINDDAVHF